MNTEYKGWSREALIERLQLLDKQAATKEEPTTEPLKELSIDSDGAPDQKSRKQTKRDKQFDFSKFSERKVALKFSYFGWPYHGLARQGNALGSDEKREIEDQYPTVEGELFKALAKCKLISGESECDYSRCGRTDRGVSGFGQ
ncbi:pseudouridine synthase deg1, partial [Coemansia sp. RSA 1933]